jgi:alpha-amylase
VEFLSETYAHSLSSLHGGEEFKRQVQAHREQINSHFGQDPKVFRNTELIYSDDIGAMVAEMGFKAMLTEGAKHVLGWKSPNYLYCNAINPKLKLLLKNFKLSDDIAFRFSNKGWVEYPLTAEKFVGWLNQVPKKEEVINLFMDYETFGEHQWKETGIFDFLAALPGIVFKNSTFSFSTPSEVAENLQVISAANVPHPISWADEERDLTAWLGNEMQQEAFNKLYSLSDKVYAVEDKDIKQDFTYLQVSDHFYYMSTKFFSDGEVHSYFNPYHTPYDAFINYMNILSDFEIRVNAALQTTVDNDVARLSKIIKEKDEQLLKLEQRLSAQKEIPGAETTPAAAGKTKSRAAATKKAAKTKQGTPAKRGTATKRSSASGQGNAAKK